MAEIGSLNVNTLANAVSDSSQAAGGKTIGQFSHSQFGAGKVQFNSSLFVGADDIQDALEGGANLRKMMPGSKKSEEAGEDYSELLNKKLEELEKVLGHSPSENVTSDNLSSLLGKLKDLEDDGKLNDSEIKRALGDGSSQEQYEMLGIVIEALRESGETGLANNLANASVIDNEVNHVSYTKMRGGLQDTMTTVADFTTMSEAMTFIANDASGNENFYQSSLKGLDWLKSGLTVELATVENPVQLGITMGTDNMLSSRILSVFISGDTKKAVEMINFSDNKEELVELEQKIQSLPKVTVHISTMEHAISSRMKTLE